MPENRFFLDKHFEKEPLKLEGEEFHHLKVMRCHEGDTVELVNGKNQLAEATIARIERNAALLDPHKITNASPPIRQVILAQSYLRPKNLDLVIEKGTELGATSFWLFPGARSEKDSLSPNQLQRLHFLTISALKQCGRLDLPLIIEMPPLVEWKQIPPGELFFGDLHSNSPFSATSDAAIFIGPEKGFSPEEEALLRTTFHAKGIRLNPHILRAETAALCALSLASV